MKSDSTRCHLNSLEISYCDSPRRGRGFQWGVPPVGRGLAGLQQAAVRSLPHFTPNRTFSVSPLNVFVDENIPSSKPVAAYTLLLENSTDACKTQTLSETQDSSDVAELELNK